MDPNTFDDMVSDFVDTVSAADLSNDTTKLQIENLRKFAELRTVVVDAPEPAPVPAPIPESAWMRVKAVGAKVWDNETTRVTIKAAGALAGVAVVAWSTIHKDHVIERQALAQANQRPV